MLSFYYNEVLDELKDAIVSDSKVLSDCIELSIEFPVRIHRCPICKRETKRIKDYRLQRVMAEPIRHKRVFLLYRKRRYVCPHCGKAFYEESGILSRYQRLTNRFIQSVLRYHRRPVSSVSVSDVLGLSASRIGRILSRLPFAPQSLPRVLTVDEFRGNAGAKFQVLFMDLEQRSLVEVLPTKDARFFEGDVIKRWDAEKRASVEYVVTDLSNQFRSALARLFPNAVFVADRFHVCRLVNNALENVRIRIQRELRKNNRRQLKRSRKLLLKSTDHLSAWDEKALRVMFTRHTDLGPAYGLKELLFRAYRSNSREEAERLFKLFIHLARRVDENCGITEFRSVIKTLEDWWEPILAFFDTGYTNGFIEGCNNKIKTLKRAGFGFPNYELFRRRIFLLFI